jgi:thiosulfate dehydrogenase [quinone] large subunit
MSQPMPDRALRWLATARIYVGCVWFAYGTSKFKPDWARTEFLSTLKDCIAHASGPIHAFLANVVVPNQGTFAWLIVYGEMLVGVALILGLFTKAGAIGGMFLSLNYFLVTGQYKSRLGLESLELMLFVFSLLLLALPSARTLSLDLLLHRVPKPKVAASDIRRVARHLILARYVAVSSSS